MYAYKRSNLIQSEDRTGRWGKKVEHYKPLMAQGASEYQPDHRFDDPVAFLFPEIVDGLGKYPPAESKNR